MNSENTLNIVVVGKSGVGKSSFLNYLLGKELFKTGMGEPVTQTYFDMQEILANDQGVKYILYDTKGIEPTTTNECRENIFKEIEKRDESSNFFEWIHSVYYCFDSTSARVEPLEYNFINALSTKVSVVVLLTKSDRVQQEKIKALSEEIRKKTSPSILIIPVCSVESPGTRKNPTPIHQSGREDVLKASFYGLWNKAATIIPYQSIEKIQNLIKTIKPQKYDVDDFEILKNDSKKQIEFLVNDSNIDRLKKIETVLQSMNCSPSKDLYDKVMNFYKKVNRFSPQLFFLTESQNVFNNLKNYNTENDILSILDAKKQMWDAWLDYDGCVFFSDAEKARLKDSIEKYNITVKYIQQKLQRKVDEFVSVYKGELLQYGRLCISNDRIEPESSASSNDLSKDEYLFATMVNYCLSAKEKIPVDNRQIVNEYLDEILDKLRIELKISKERAFKIWN